MWVAEQETMEGGRVSRATVLCHGEPMSYGEAIERWQDDAAFREHCTTLIAGAPYRAALWETPPITRESAGRAFAFVLVESAPLAALAPDPEAFAAHFEAAGPGAEVAVFPNLGGDALLVAPCPLGPPESYTHLAAFLRGAPADQRHAFWQSLGAAVAGRLGDRPLWLSTNGLGVAWLHARLDSRPKYYSYAPYREGGRVHPD